MKVLLSTCLLLALLSAEAALKCKACFGCGGKCREEDMKTVECAPNQDTCVALSANFTFYDFPFNVTHKGCTTSKECQILHFAGSTTANKYGYLKTHCCQTDKCNEEDLQWANYKRKPNGLQCPGFFSTADSCYGPETVHCVGIENQCADVLFDMSPFGLPAKQMIYRGCVNQQICAQKPGLFHFADGLLKFSFYDLHCYSPKRSCKHHEAEL